MPNTVASKDGTCIAVDRYGAGPPLVSVDGATAGGAMVVSLAPVLALHVTVFPTISVVTGHTMIRHATLPPWHPAVHDDHPAPVEGSQNAHDATDGFRQDPASVMLGPRKH